MRDTVKLVYCVEYFHKNERKNSFLKVIRNIFYAIFAQSLSSWVDIVINYYE